MRRCHGEALRPPVGAVPLRALRPTLVVAPGHAGTCSGRSRRGLESAVGAVTWERTQEAPTAGTQASTVSALVVPEEISGGATIAAMAPDVLPTLLVGDGRPGVAWDHAPVGRIGRHGTVTAARSAPGHPRRLRGSSQPPEGGVAVARNEEYRSVGGALAG